MQVFYTNQINGDVAILGEDESKHCTKVLRKKVGETIHFIDGRGSKYIGIISELHKKGTWIKIQKKEEIQKWPFSIHIAIAPTKNINRIEWFLEKCTEIGIDEITFIKCDRSERKNVRIDRLNKVVLSATKQSLKAHIPIINPLITYKDFITKIDNEAITKYICWVSEKNSDYIKEKFPDKSTLILIGPEGDFSPSEIELALKHNFKPISLGPSRLRTETAGIVACHLTHILHEIY